MKSVRIALVAVLLTGTAAFAEGTFDADGDSLVTLEEIQAVYPDFSAEQFASADLDGNGTLDEAELTAALDAGILPTQE